jgi:hypothetical protein
VHCMAVVVRAARAHRRPSCGKEDREGTSVSRATHRGGTATWRRRFDQARRCLTAVEARRRRRHAPMSLADGEGDGGGELRATTEGRRKGLHRGGYHREW